MESGQTTLARNVQGDEGSLRLEGCADALAGRRLVKASWKGEELSHIFRKGCGVGRALGDAGCATHTVNLRRVSRSEAILLFTLCWRVM